MGTIELVWVDLETTGLESDNDEILEVCLVGTDRFGSHPVTIVDELVYPSRRHWSWWKENMAYEAKEMHKASGLMAAIDKLAADPRFSEIEDVERLALHALTSLDLEPGKYEMCGSSVHFDRAFIEVHMPKLFGWFHYRNLDVSTLKNVCRHVNPRVASQAPKPSTKAHRAHADIMDTLEEYQYYLDELILVSDAE